MRLDAIELRHVRLPLVTPFRTSEGLQTVRDAVLVRVATDVGDGWGECVAQLEPTYTSEHLAGAWDVISTWLGPTLAQRRRGVEPIASPASSASSEATAWPRPPSSWRSSTPSCRRRAPRSPARLGAVRPAVPAGVAVGIQPTIDALVATVGGYVAAGLPAGEAEDRTGPRPRRRGRGAGGMARARPPGRRQRRLHPRRRRAPGSARRLRACCSSSSRWPATTCSATPTLARRIATPLCLDESIVSVDTTRTALHLGACSVVNLKPGRVGGYLEALRIHDVCVEAGAGLWCGGMLETGIGRAANAALAALPGFTLPGDLSASSRYFATDVTEPLELVDGCLEVPTRPGIGVAVREAVVEELTVARHVVTRPV